MKKVEWFVHDNGEIIDADYMRTIIEEKDPADTPSTLIDGEGFPVDEDSEFGIELKNRLNISLSLDLEKITRHTGDVLYIGQEDIYSGNSEQSFQRVVKFIVKEEDSGLVWSLHTFQIRYI